MGALSLTKVDSRGVVPKYQQAREILMDAIRTGQITPGTKLPSTKEISSIVDVSLITAHRALDELVNMGWLRREVGRGTFVCDDIDLVKDQKKELSIALILEQHDQVNIDDYYHGTLINALRREARADSCHVEFFFHDRFDMRRGKRRNDAAAICVHPGTDRQDAVEQLAAERPTVVLGGTFDNAKIACVDCANDYGAREAIRHLVSLGHRRIMVLGSPPTLSNSRDRTDAAIDEIKRSGHAVDQKDLLVSRDTVLIDEGMKARIARRMQERDRPTAIFAGGFYLALAAMHSVRNVGLSIPDDVSVIGFDDPASAPFLDPPLTTIRQPLEAMASTAYVTVRDALLGGRVRPECSKLSPDLIVRRSTGPVRSEA